MRPDTHTTTVEAAAAYERERSGVDDWPDPERPTLADELRTEDPTLHEEAGPA